MSGRLGRLYRGQTDIDFVGRRRLWFAISGIALVTCVVLLGGKGLNYGIEFEGGVSIQAPIDDPALADASVREVESRIRDALQPFGASDAQVQVASEDSQRSVLVQTKEVADPEIQQEVVSAVSEAVGASAEATDSQRIGSKWGAEITRKALRALIIFVIVILLFISWRFEWKMAVAAIVALIHDLLITAGVYSGVGFEVTPSSVIAILTILGYSLYDTVVVFDKVEENVELHASSGKMTYEKSANLAMNQVVMRSLNTSLTSLLPIGGLLFVGAGLLGAETLKDLALALFVGILVGTYSSIFVATPVLTVFKEREPRYVNVRERVLRDAKRAQPAAPAEPEPEREPGPAPAPAPVPVPSTGSATRPPARARAGSKKARRRKRR